MREIRTSIEIDAPRETVWETLADFESYGEWNPHIPRASGELREGGSVELTVVRVGAGSRTMTVTVAAIEPPRRLQWIGTVGFGWMFEGRHTFELHPLDDDRTRFVNHERLSGFLVPFAVSDDPRLDYDRMNEALKGRVERRN